MLKVESTTSVKVIAHKDQGAILAIHADKLRSVEANCKEVLCGERLNTFWGARVGDRKDWTSVLSGLDLKDWRAKVVCGPKHLPNVNLRSVLEDAAATVELSLERLTGNMVKHVLQGRLALPCTVYNDLSKCYYMLTAFDGGSFTGTVLHTNGEATNSSGLTMTCDHNRLVIPESEWNDLPF
jgi:hypothetical protein